MLKEQLGAPSLLIVKGERKGKLKKLLRKMESELKDLKNSHPERIAKNEKVCSEENM